jgi:hypothetical protein
MMAKNDSIASMIEAAVKEYNGTKRQYAIYLVGWHIGAAVIKNEFGEVHVLNADAL